MSDRRRFLPASSDEEELTRLRFTLLDCKTFLRKLKPHVGHRTEGAEDALIAITELQKGARARRTYLEGLEDGEYDAR